MAVGGVRRQPVTAGRRRRCHNAIIDFEKDAYEAYFLRGCLYCKQGNAEAAKTDFANAVKYKGNDYKLYIQIYENLLTLDEEEEAQGYLSKALQIKGNEVGNYENRGQIYYLMGEYDSAITELSTALEAGSTYANLYLAKTYDDMGDVATAEDYLKTYIASVPTDSTALNELGEMMLAGEKYAEAVLYLEQGLACEVVPSRGVLMHNLIVAYEYNGNFDKAWELVQEYVKLFPEDEGAQREYIFLKNRQMKEESTQDTEPAQDTQ